MLLNTGFLIKLYIFINCIVYFCFLVIVFHVDRVIYLTILYISK